MFVACNANDAWLHTLHPTLDAKASELEIISSLCSKKTKRDAMFLEKWDCIQSVELLESHFLP